MATKKTTDAAVEAAAENAESTAKTVKVKVIKTFKDKETAKIHKVGETLEIFEERYAEILKVGKFVRKV